MYARQERVVPKKVQRLLYQVVWAVTLCVSSYVRSVVQAIPLPPVPSGGPAFPLRALNDTSVDYPFLPEWEPTLVEGPTGCNNANTGHWSWRISGLGCNMVRLLSAYEYWVYGWGWDNLAIIVSAYFDGVSCAGRAPGTNVHGWDCIFRPMPHICTFRTKDEYLAFLTAQGAPHETVYAALQLTEDDLWKDPRPGRPYPGFQRNPHPSLFESRAMVARHIWGYLQPWVNDDLRTLRECLPAEVTEHPYVGLHIRRGDKLLYEARLTPSEQYLNVTVTRMLEHHDQCREDGRGPVSEHCAPGSFPLPEEVRGVYVASDDGLVVQEIRSVVRTYLPNVLPSSVVYTSDGKSQCTLGAEAVVTRVKHQDYLAMIYLLHDIERLKAAGIFVGTFSSNLGRFITTLRGSGKASFGAENDRPHWKPN